MKRKLPKKKSPYYSRHVNFFVPIVEKVKHCVVAIETYRQKEKTIGKPYWISVLQPQLQEEPPANVGSGFIIHSKGFILTNEHVIQDANEINIKFYNGQQTTAKKVWEDTQKDLAILKVSLAKPLRTLPLGSSRKARVGETVLSIGNPMGLENTITTGIISAKNRNIYRAERLYEDLIQTDCAINPGNSGGPLINWKGEVIGINSFIVKDNQGLGFSIGIDSVKEAIRKQISI